MKAVITVKMKDIGHGWVASQAYHEGKELEGINHTSSSEGWAKHDMENFKKEEYELLFPQGYELIFEKIKDE